MRRMQPALLGVPMVVPGLQKPSSHANLIGCAIAACHTCLLSLQILSSQPDVTAHVIGHQLSSLRAELGWSESGGALCVSFAISS